jgi:hypothetical protein
VKWKNAESPAGTPGSQRLIRRGLLSGNTYDSAIMASTNENCNSNGEPPPDGAPPRPPLHPRHLEDLRRSGLKDETVAAGEFYSVDGREVAALLNWKPSARSPVGPCLAIPLPGR